jgi:CubicO group peptidase (beta-lactamase class C family)
MFDTPGRCARHVPLSATLAALAMLCVISPAGALAQTKFPPNHAVDKIFAKWDKPDSPGCALGVLQNGRFIYQRGYGMANLDYDIPNAPTMVYYIGSDSKQFTDAAIALLVLEGKLSLDDDIRKYIPEMPDYGTPITINHLIHHTSGIRDIYTLMSLAGRRIEDVFSDSEELALIARQKELNFKPGDDYLYSNSGYFLLAEIVKRVTGESLREFADERIFKPLDMTHSHFHDDPGHIMKNRAMSYEPDGHGGFQISYLQNFDKIGAGGLYSTVEDLRKWDENFYTHQVGGDALQRLMHTRGVLNNGDTITYAFGNEISTYRGLRTVEHGGSMMGYKAHILRFPDQHFSVIETCNLGSINPGPLAHAVAEVYLGGKMGPKPERKATAVAAAQRDDDAAGEGRGRGSNAGGSGGAASADLSALAGDYYSSELDATYHLSLVDGALVLQGRNRKPVTLVATGPNTFRAGALIVRFQRTGAGGATGTPTELTVDAGRVRNIGFQRK